MKLLSKFKQMIQYPYSVHKYVLLQIRMYVGARNIKLLAEQYDAEAQAILGAMYSKGVGVATDNCEAIKWYSSAAKEGNTSAQLILGTRYAIGNGVVQNHRLAFHWYLEAARQNNKRAQIALKFMQMNGIGVR